MAIPSSILILGAGELGTAILTSLTSHPNFNAKTTKITLLLRPKTFTTPSPPKQKELSNFSSLNISFLPGDLITDSEKTLAQKFAPFEVVIACTGMTTPSGTQLKITKAVLTAKVPYYIPWQFGVNYDLIGRNSSQNLFTEQLDVRDLLREAGQTITKWNIFSTGMFMSFLCGEGFGVVGWEKGVVRCLGDWGNGVTVTRVEDIGIMVAEVIFGGGEVGSGVVFVAGETISYARLADVVEEVTGKKVEREEWSLAFLMEELAQDPDDGMKKYRVVFAEGKGVAWDIEESLNVKRGMKLQGVQEWLREH